ncbi:MAG: carboxylating nicotinate-nucleotide diphosphorylase [Longimicrobiales bacterium]
MAALSDVGPPESLADIVRRALREDVGPGDWTTQWTVPAEAHASGRILARADGVVAGLDAAREVFRQLDADVRFDAERENGDAVGAEDVVARLAGPARPILTGERTALNLLQRLSGVATLTRAYVTAVNGTGTRILDTRKTTPGLRALEKAAVRAGGGVNHRSGLHDLVLIKENHIAIAGGIARALDAVLAVDRGGLDVEVETRSLDEVRQAIDAGARRILLDNFEADQAAAAVSLGSDHGVRFEASGNMTPERAAAMARAGVHDVSVGALTHSAPALDLSLLLDGPP